MVILGFIFLYIIPLGMRPLTIPDETRYAEIPREMLNTGDWVVPRLNGLRYFEKPVLGYWANALSIKLLGENAFAVRLPSALAIGLIAFLIFLLARKFAKKQTTGLLAAGVYLTCVEVLIAGTFCILDGLFSMFVTATFVTFYFAYRTESSRKKAGYLALSGAACGLAFLVKGFIAFAIPSVAIVPFLLWDRKINTIWKLFWIPVLTLILVALPWSIMIYLRENDFWRYFFWQEHVNRFFGDYAQHYKPVWYFVPVIIICALPWTATLPDIIKGLKKTRCNEPFIRFLICWLIFPFLFFSASHGKLASYILPCFPPLAILITLGLMKHFSANSCKTSKRIFPVSAILLFICILALTAIHTIFPEFAIYTPKETWKWVFVSIALLWYAAFLVFESRNTNAENKIILCCLAPMCLMFSVPFILPDSLRPGKMPEEFMANHSEKVTPDTIILSDSGLIPAVCWYYHRDDVYLLSRYAGEFTYGLSYEDSKYKEILIDKFADFIKHTSKNHKVILITREKSYNGDRENLPEPINEVVDCGFVMAEYALPSAKNDQ